MYCVVCQNDIARCTCDDIDERLADLRANARVKFAYCERCGKHVDRCACVIDEAGKRYVVCEPGSGIYQYQAFGFAFFWGGTEALWATADGPGYTVFDERAEADRVITDAISIATACQSKGLPLIKHWRVVVVWFATTDFAALAQQWAARAAPQRPHPRAAGTSVLED